MVLRKNRNVCVRVAAIAANDNPYDMANVAERNRGLYAAYF